MISMTEYVYVMSFDIAIRNQACHIEKFPKDKLKELCNKNIPTYQRYDKNKECTSNFKTLLYELYRLGERVYTDKIDLALPGAKKKGNKFTICNKILVKLTNYLEDLNEKKVFDKVDYFVIEEQLKKNPTAQQLAYHIRAYLIMLFLEFKPIIMFPSKYKTQILGAPYLIYDEKKKKLVKLGTKRKKWATEKVMEIFLDRNDKQGIDEFFVQKKYGKPDDTCDCVLMDMAFTYMYFIDNKKWLVN
jgi:hypothetical protein